jgi:hypothetical protein
MEHVATFPVLLKPPYDVDFSDWVELNGMLLDLDPVAMSLDDRFRVTANVDRGTRPVVLPVDQAIQKLESARSAAKARNLDLLLFACTEARAAVAVSADTDPRDRKYLSGARTMDGLAAYCGGLNAAIHRALLFAHHADVVCLKTTTIDLNEARRFVKEVRGAFPGKGLGFGHSPRPDGEAWNENSHTQLERELRGIGFDYYFVTQFGSTVFPNPPVAASWTLFDDAVPASRSSAGEMTNPAFKLRAPWLSRLSALRARSTGRGRVDRAS